MKDQVFDGATVEEAVSAASRALATPSEGLRYVVLDAGTVAARGLTARPARIAVLLGAAAAPENRASAPAADPAHTPPAAMGVAEVAAEIRELVRELARAADADLSGEVTTTDEAVTVRLEGKGKDLLLEDEGDVLESLEYLIQLMYRRAIEPRRLVVDCEGYRSDRDRALREEALALAASVAGDGVPRKMRALNSFERRVVHASLTDHPEVRTFSVGEGGERRVTVAPKPPAGETRG
jgi:spoIIIJ-associated protein